MRDMDCSGAAIATLVPTRSRYLVLDHEETFDAHGSICLDDTTALEMIDRVRQILQQKLQRKMRAENTHQFDRPSLDHRPAIDVVGSCISGKMWLNVLHFHERVQL